MVRFITRMSCGTAFEKSFNDAVNGKIGTCDMGKQGKLLFSVYWNCALKALVTTVTCTNKAFKMCCSTIALQHLASGI